MTIENEQPPSEQNLRQAVKAIDALQIAELENFLGCDLSRLVKLDETSIDLQAMQVYPIVLSNRLIAIIEIPGYPLILREIPVSRSQIEETVTNLQVCLTQPGKTPEILEQSQQIYRWLIEPLEVLIQNHSHIETLVFITDSMLRSIPFGVLYDGEEYLIEKDYAIAISPKLESFAPVRSTKLPTVLTGGVEISQTTEGIDFGAIAQAEQELTIISASVDTSNFLLNELQSIIQIASQSGQKPLELLVLSAYETAKGYNRAILGLEQD